MQSSATIIGVTRNLPRADESVSGCRNHHPDDPHRPHEGWRTDVTKDLTTTITFDGKQASP